MILLSTGRRWSRTEAFGEVAGQDRGEARWGQDRGECRHPDVFRTWECIKTALSPLPQSKRVARWREYCRACHSSVHNSLP